MRTRKCLLVANQQQGLSSIHRATLIAKGSILKALHRHAIRETVMRCSIGFAWNEEYQRGVHKEHYDPAIHGRRKVVMDYHDGAKVVSDRVHWLFRIVSF